MTAPLMTRMIAAAIQDGRDEEAEELLGILSSVYGEDETVTELQRLFARRNKAIQGDLQ